MLSTLLVRLVRSSLSESCVLLFLCGVFLPDTKFSHFDTIPACAVRQTDKHMTRLLCPWATVYTAPCPSYATANISLCAEPRRVFAANDGCTAYSKRKHDTAHGVLYTESMYR